MGKGGGGGLAFLNKKSWHPGGFKQQEDVWKREQAKAQEEKRLEELKKQIAEEREAQELLRAAQEAGHATKTERLEFMYKGGGSAVLQGLASASALALPTPAVPEPGVPLPAALAAPAVTAAASAVAVYVDDTPKARNEAWARLHGDPMLMIKQQEQTAMKSIRANPVKMDSIMREVEALKAARRAKKEAKHAKKEAKRERKQSRHDEGAHGGDYGRDASHGGGAAQGAPVPAARAERRRSRSPRASSQRAASPPRRRSRSRERRRSREREHRRSRSRSRERRRSRSRSRDGHRVRDHDRDASNERRRERHGNEPRPAKPSGTSDAQHGLPAAADGACAQKGVAAYGLTFASAEAEEAARAKAEARGNAHAYEPVLKPAAPEPPPTWARGRNSAGHRAGKLTEEERTARLAAMSMDAEQHEDERWQRLRREAAREAGDASMEQHAPAHHHTEKPGFLGEKERELFGGTEGGPSGMSMAERVGARKHFQQRGSDSNAFRR